MSIRKVTVFEQSKKNKKIQFSQNASFTSVIPSYPRRSKFMTEDEYIVLASATNERCTL